MALLGFLATDDEKIGTVKQASTDKQEEHPESASSETVEGDYSAN